MPAPPVLRLVDRHGMPPYSPPTWGPPPWRSRTRGVAAARPRQARHGVGRTGLGRRERSVAGRARGIITVEQLREAVKSGTVDTVVSAVCDMQGRLVGKRVTGEFFVEHCL